VQKRRKEKKNVKKKKSRKRWKKLYNLNDCKSQQIKFRVNVKGSSSEKIAEIIKIMRQCHSKN
jgi:cytidylate kinase